MYGIYLVFINKFSDILHVWHVFGIFNYYIVYRTVWPQSPLSSVHRWLWCWLRRCILYFWPRYYVDCTPTALLQMCFASHQRKQTWSLQQLSARHSAPLRIFACEPLAWWCQMELGSCIKPHQCATSFYSVCWQSGGPPWASATISMLPWWQPWHHSTIPYK